MNSPSLTLASPPDVLAAVPYLLGFTPTDSVVVIGLRAKKIIFQVRADLPPAGTAGDLAAQVATVVARQRVEAAIVIGYGSEPAVTPAIDALRESLDHRDIRTLEALRATSGRYWSALCTRSDCCPAGGTPYDVSTSAVAAAATVAGIGTVASREEFAARLAPVVGPARESMRDAALRADLRLCELLDERPSEPSGPVLLAAGKAAVDMAALRIAYHGQLDDDDVAWLALLLINPPVRDYAWSRVGDDVEMSIDLWTEILRRAEPELVAPPATLLAFASWRDGDGALASIALERAYDADPNYPMARLLLDTIQHGVSPADWMDLIHADEKAAVHRRPRRRPDRFRGRGRRGRI